MMQIPPHGLLLEHHIRKTPSEAAKYVRTEYRDNNPSWLLAEGANNGHAHTGGDSKTAISVRRVTPELPGHVLMRDRSGADH